MKKSILVILCFAMILLPLTGCQTKPQMLTIGALSDVSSVPLFIAKQQGFFEGADIRIELFKSAADRDAALQSGAIDGAVSDALATAFAITGGFDVKITSRTEGAYRLVAAKDSGIASVADLAGRTVAISPNTIIEYCVDRMSAAAGLAQEDFTKEVIREMPVRLEMLASGQVDSACLPEPLASTAVLSGGTIVGDSTELGIDISIMLFSNEAIEKKTDAIRAFYKGYDQAGEYINNADDALIMQAMIDDAGFPETVRDTLVLPEYRPAAMSGQASFEECIAWMVERGLIERTVSFDEARTTKFYQ